MQTLADVLNRPIKIVRSEQTCALGAAMFAATASGIYENVSAAMQNMGSGFELTYTPSKNLVPIYNELYKKYSDAAKSLEKSN